MTEDFEFKMKSGKVSYGMPYKGSKQAIIKLLAEQFPKADNFYDLFGGGFSVTHFLIENKRDNYKQFHFNEIDTGVVELIKKAINGDYSFENFTPEWVSRETFFREKESDPYIKFCWSFGNNGRDYLFGKNVEGYKRSMHMAVVFDIFDDIVFDILGFRKWPKEIDTITKRRLYLSQKVSFLNKKRENPLKRGELERLEPLERLEKLQRLEQLEQLERLQRLERLQQLQNPRLSITSKDYREVEILKDSIVYCDIPYQGTNKYNHEFSHVDFFNWASSVDFPVFISEYEISDERFELVFEIEKRSLIQANGVNNIKKERLYRNKKTVN